MISGYTVYFSYYLTSSNNVNECGYSNAIHCNYINSIKLDSIVNKEVNINFTNINDFKFLSTNGTYGYSANKIFILIQLLDNSKYSSESDIIPDSASWKKYEVTNQVSGYTTGNTFTLTPANITSTIFSVPLYTYGTLESYNLSYLNYPTTLYTDDNKLCFGDEEIFMGNVSTDIEAIAYSTDLVINLPLNQFNTTNNLTWDNLSQVYITEIGLYDTDLNLVGIAKLNNPIPKDSTISRTLVFGLDF